MNPLEQLVIPESQLRLNHTYVRGSRSAAVVSTGNLVREITGRGDDIHTHMILIIDSSSAKAHENCTPPSVVLPASPNEIVLCPSLTSP
jgi:hypothetical protein